MRYILAIPVLALAAAAPAGFEMWSGAQLTAAGKKLAAKGDKVGLEQLGMFDDHAVVLVYRNADGESEVHETQHDIFVVRSGQGTLVVGGTITGGKTTAPHEIRGTSISGGEKRNLAPGDIVHIPARVPHQVLVEAGKQITYAIVKIDLK